MEEGRRLTFSGQPQESRREVRDQGGCGEVKELPLPAEDQPRHFSDTVAARSAMQTLPPSESAHPCANAGPAVNKDPVVAAAAAQPSRRKDNRTVRDSF